MLTVKAFGTLDVRDETGEPLPVVLSQPKRAALLAYLAVSHLGEFHTRDALLALFWPESNQVRGRSALSQALSFLRRQLGKGVLVTRGTEDVGVDVGEITSDVQAFEEALAEEDWKTALEAYGGDLLDGLHANGAAPFMDWVDRERERLREAAADAGWRCANERIAAGELTGAERTAQRALTLVPTDESRVRAFIQALADAGDRAASLRFYEKFRSLLAAELEVDPAPETVAVMEGIRRRSEVAEVLEATAPPTMDFPEGEIDRPPSIAATIAPRVRPRRSTGRRIAAAAVMAALLLVSYGLVRYVRSGGPGTLLGQGLAKKYDQVVVADFAASPYSLGFLAAEWLRVDMDQSDIIRPVSPADIGAALRRMGRDPSRPVDAETAREIAVRDGYPLVVEGEIQVVGSGYMVTARLEGAPGGELYGRFRAAARQGDGLIDALDDVSADIRQRIGESLRDIRRSPPLEQVATPSLEALRLYSDAVRLDERLYRPLDAIPLYERAIALDTGFASAYYKLSWTLNELGTQWARELELSRKAYEHRDRLTEFQAAQAEGHYASLRLTQWADTASGGPDGCAIAETMLRTASTYVRRHPEDPRLLLYLGYWQNRLGHDDEAMETYRKLVTLLPSSWGGYNNLALIQMGLRRFGEARKTLDVWRAQVGASAKMLLAEASLAAREGDYDATESAEVAFITAYGGDFSNTMDLGNLDAVRGRMREAWAHYDSAISSLVENGDPIAPIHQIAQRALVRLVARHDTSGALGDVGPALAAMAHAPDTVDLSRLWGDVGLVHALAGSPGPAHRALEALGGPGRGRWKAAREKLGAALATSQGEPRRALELLASARTPCGLLLPQGGERADYHYRLLHILAGRAYEALTEPDSAIAEYEAYFTERYTGYPMPLDAAFVFDTLERLGRLHEARGDSAEAAASYSRAADLWKDADPELQPRVQALRERAAALDGTGPPT